MAAILPRHVLSMFLLIAQELHVIAQWNFICIYILIRAILIQNKKCIDMMSSGVKGQKIDFIGLLPISLEVIELDPWKLWTMCWLPIWCKWGVWFGSDQEESSSCLLYVTQKVHALSIKFLCYSTSGFWLWYNSRRSYEFCYIMLHNMRYDSF